MHIFTTTICNKIYIYIYNLLTHPNILKVLVLSESFPLGLDWKIAVVPLNIC